MAKSKTTKSAKRPIEQYSHTGKKRPNNPPVGLVTPNTDQAETTRTYAYDPHIDPSLQWAGKVERTSFEIPTVSLHVHERIDPRTILEAVRKKNGSNYEQMSLFSSTKENPPLREAVEFYKHAHGWSNRLIAGDSLLVMNSLLEKEGMAGNVQMVYFDPPYGIKYGSNFQPFVNKRDVKDGKDEDLTAEPEMIKAFRDTWELGIHSYLTYLRDRLLLTRELMASTGSCFIQISDENLHYVRQVSDEVFGRSNFSGLIAFRTTGGQSTSLLSTSTDFLVWYAKDKIAARDKFRQPTLSKQAGRGGSGQYSFVEPRDGSEEPRQMTDEELEHTDGIDKRFRILAHDTLYSQGAPSDAEDRLFEWRDKPFQCPPNTHWKPGVKSGGMQRLANANRLMLVGNTLRYKRYLEDYPVVEVDNVWNDTAISGFARKKQYVVETSPKVIERCVVMTTDPGDLILDVTCGSGTTAVVAEQWGRRWITCDTSRVSLTLAKQRVMASVFEYYQLARPDEGVDSGFRYKTVPHIMLSSIANNEPAITETLYNEPIPDTSKTRVSGPFTVEAVPAPTVRSLDDLEKSETISTADNSVARSGATLRQNEWTNELLRTGVRGKGGQRIEFSRLEPMPGTRYLNADAETRSDKPERVVVSFGPEYAPLEQRQVELALEEAQSLVPRPKIVLFAAFQFDPEASKDIDETNWPGVTLLKAQMNVDLFTEDLKKKRSSNESFWLIGQPDVQAKKLKDGDHKDDFVVSVGGFDYYNTKTGTIESGGVEKIAMWLLDTDYDGRSLFPRQVFFPIAGEKEGWSRLAKNLRAEIDEDLIEAYRGTESVPFSIGKNRRAAVKIIDDRGIESLRILDLK
jgi:adenine-specific DNA-methyltransferase